ncbi:MAG: hypothetical protein R2705_15855 [Ilumatobacteraceae bacterium]
MDLEGPAGAGPGSAMRAVRDQGWLGRTLFGYVVSRHEDVTAVLRDKRWHSAAAKVAEFSGITDEEFLDSRRESILSSEGETHARLRRLVGQAFSPRSADRLRPFMRTVISELLAPSLDSGRVEAVTQLCEPYPIPIICELLGAPKEDWQSFSRWAGDVLRVFDGNLERDLPIIKQASAELDAYVTTLIERRRSVPADDLLTDLIAAEEAGDRLSGSELVMMVQAVIVGGTDTTRNQLGCCWPCSPSTRSSGNCSPPSPSSLPEPSRSA